MEALKKFPGVIPDIPDVRDHFMTAAAQAYTLPIVLDLPEVYDQGDTGRCNVYCDLNGPEIAFRKKFSNNLTYGLCVGAVPGTSPRETAQSMIDIGMPPASIDPINDLDTPDIKTYIDARKDKLVTAAKPYRFERYVFLHSVDEIRAAMLLAQKTPGAYIKYTMPIDGSSPDKYGYWDLKKITKPTGYHEVAIAAEEMHQYAGGMRDLVKSKNSWGKTWGSKPTTLGGDWGGHGYFWTDWDSVLMLDNIIAVFPYSAAVSTDGVFHTPLRLKDTRMTDAVTGGEVSWVQRRLVVHGIVVDVDGIYGPLTEKAVKRFQIAKGLAVDGVVGPITWAALAKDPADTQPDNDADINAALKADLLGYLQGAVGSIYCWGGNGQSAITESIIRSMETSSSNATRTIKFWRKQQAAGVANLRMFDCSGLPSRWLQDHNFVPAKRNCDHLWAMCDPIIIADLEACDLLFKGTKTDKTHVGVYLGDGKVIEARGRDYGVVIRDMSAGGWQYAGQLRRLKE